MVENKTLSIKVSSVLYKRLKELAKQDNCFVSWLLNRAVSNYLISRKSLKE